MQRRGRRTSFCARDATPGGRAGSSRRGALGGALHGVLSWGWGKVPSRRKRRGGRSIDEQRHGGHPLRGSRVFSWEKGHNTGRRAKKVARRFPEFGDTLYPVTILLLRTGEMSRFVPEVLPWVVRASFRAPGERCKKTEKKHCTPLDDFLIGVYNAPQRPEEIFGRTKREKSDDPRGPGGLFRQRGGLTG